MTVILGPGTLRSVGKALSTRSGKAVLAAVGTALLVGWLQGWTGLAADGPVAWGVALVLGALGGVLRYRSLARRRPAW